MSQETANYIPTPPLVVVSALVRHNSWTIHSNRSSIFTNFPICDVKNHIYCHDQCHCLAIPLIFCLLLSRQMMLMLMLVLRRWSKWKVSRSLSIEDEEFGCINYNDGDNTFKVRQRPAGLPSSLLLVVLSLWCETSPTQCAMTTDGLINPCLLDWKIQIIDLNGIFYSVGDLIIRLLDLIPLFELFVWWGII